MISDWRRSETPVNARLGWIFTIFTVVFAQLCNPKLELRVLLSNGFKLLTNFFFLLDEESFFILEF